MLDQSKCPVLELRELIARSVLSNKVLAPGVRAVLGTIYTTFLKMWDLMKLI